TAGVERSVRPGSPAGPAAARTLAEAAVRSPAAQRRTAAGPAGARTAAVAPAAERTAVEVPAAEQTAAVEAPAGAGTAAAVAPAAAAREAAAERAGRAGSAACAGSTSSRPTSAAPVDCLGLDTTPAQDSSWAGS